MVKTTLQLVEQVKGTYHLIEYAVKNLKNMPTDANIFGWLTSMESQISGILGQVQSIGFSLDRTTRDFEKLYGNIAALTTPEGRAERYRQMRDARLEMTAIAMQTQSIKETFTGIYTRLSTPARHLVLGLGAEGAATAPDATAGPGPEAATAGAQYASRGRSAGGDGASGEDRQGRDARRGRRANSRRNGMPARYLALPPGFQGFRILPRGAE